MMITSESYRFYVRDGSMRKISVGTNTIWGTSGKDEVYIREGISLSEPKGTIWKKVAGDLHLIVVNVRTNSTWGVTRTENVFYRVGSSIANPEGEYWKNIPGKLKQISYGHAGLWGCNSQNEVYYRCGTRGGVGESGIYWECIKGAFIHVSSGEDIVLAVSTDNLLYVRLGISEENPIGTDWFQLHQLDFELSYVDITNVTGDVWGLKKNGNIFHIKKSKFAALTQALLSDRETDSVQCSQS